MTGPAIDVNAVLAGADSRAAEAAEAQGRPSDRAPEPFDVIARNALALRALGDATAACADALLAALALQGQSAAQPLAAPTAPPAAPESGAPDPLHPRVFGGRSAGE